MDAFDYEVVGGTSAR